MRYRDPLDGIFFNATANRVVRALLKSERRAMTGRGVARMAKAPPHRTAEVLRRLRSEGLVRAQNVGNATLWSLNEKHPLVPALRAVYAAEARAREAQKERIRRAVEGAGEVERAVIFGSAARGDEREGSDLDLLVVAANRSALRRLEERLGELRLDLWRENGTHLSPLLYTAAEFRRKRRLAVVQAAEREGEILIAGREGR